MIEALIAFACVLLAAAVWLRTATTRGRIGGALSIVVMSGVALAFAPPPPVRAPGAPQQQRRAEYVSSQACRSCHPGPYESWHRSFHRTMTSLATPDTVLGPFQGTRLDVGGRRIELEQRGDSFYATLPDPDLVAELALRGDEDPSREVPLVKRRVVMTTGSHHYQAYWVNGKRGNELRLLPAVYLIGERRFIPRRDAFLQPPDARHAEVRWNSNCVMCHSVAGRPQHDQASDRFSTEAVELGIACEACHGPGAAHVERHRNPLERLERHLGGGPDETIVNPARLGAERGSEVCAQCHSYFVPRDEERWWQSGFAEAYRPGEVLAASRKLLDFERDRENFDELVSAELDSIFWSDGTIRIGGREHNALAQSKCHSEGAGRKKLGCLSCHSMHRSEPDDQLSADGRGDAACASCHTEQARLGSGHTHHAPDSPGSRCYGCHMPYTSYALFKGIRSHRIDSPSAAGEARTGRPNACNGCHNDRTLAWAGEKLAAWYGAPLPELAESQKSVSATLLALYSGDAAERALAAYALGLPDSARASGKGWQAPHLAALLDDPYSAVRLVAFRALAAQPGFERFDYDFLAPPEALAAARARALARYHEQTSRERRPELLFRHDGSPDRDRIAELARARDDRPITIAE